jgi:hypothetical protein
MDDMRDASQFFLTATKKYDLLLQNYSHYAV